MSAYDVLVRFRASVGEFIAPVEAARAKVVELDKSVSKMSESEAWKKTGTAALALGAAIVAAGAYAVTSAMSWESAWTGVAKAVNGTSTEMATLQDDLKGLVATLPAAATEIAAVAENAGQLGIRTADIGRFTKAMIGLGESTNLTSEEASTAIAQIANIMGTTSTGLDRMASTLVALGNAGASTEKDIVSMSVRIAAAGKLIGLSEAQVMAYSSALTSVGVEAEAGGTALAQTFAMIRESVDAGGESLTAVARTAGMTGEQFAKAFKTDAAGAIASFVTGLDAVEKSGGSATAVLDQLGMSGVRQKQALLSLASAGSLLTDQLALGDKAWQQNSALAIETARRYATTESQVRIAGNVIQQTAANIGSAALPAVAGLAKGVGDLANAWGNLPGGVQTGAVSLVGIVGVAALVTGGTMKLITAVSEAKVALQTLGVSSSAIGPRMRTAALGLAVAAAAFVALEVAQDSWSASAQRATTKAGELAVSMSKVGGINTADLNAAFNMDSGVASLSGLTEAVAALKVNAEGGFWTDLGNKIWGAGSKLGLAKAQVAELDKAIASYAQSGNTAAAAQAFGQFSAEASRMGMTSQQVLGYFPEYKAQLESVAKSLGGIPVTADEYVAWMGGKVPDAIKAAADANPDLVAGLDSSTKALALQADSAAAAADALRAQVSATREANRANIEASGSIIGVYEAEAELAKRVTEVNKNLKEKAAALNATKTAFNLDTEAGRENQKALNDLASATLNTKDAMEKQGKSTEDVNAMTVQARDKFIAAALAMGLTAQAAEWLATQYGLVPTDVTTKVTAPGAPVAISNAEDLKRALANLPPQTAADVMSVWQRYGYDDAVDALNKLDGKRVYTYVDTVYNPVQGALNQSRASQNAGHKATGSWVSGPGTGTSDTAGLYWLSDGEFIMRERAASSIESTAPGLLEFMNAYGKLPGLATGGSPGVMFAPAAAFSGSSGPVFNDNRTVLTIAGIEVTASSPNDALAQLDAALRARMAGQGIKVTP